MTEIIYKHIEFEDLLPRPEEVLSSLRSDLPTILTISFQDNPYLSITLISPIGYALRSVSSKLMQDPIMKWVDRSNQKIVFKTISSIIDVTIQNKEYCPRVFGPHGDYLGVGINSPPFLYLRATEPIFIPTSSEKSVTTHLASQVSQFPQLAFLPLDENLSHKDLDPANTENGRKTSNAFDYVISNIPRASLAGLSASKELIPLQKRLIDFQINAIKYIEIDGRIPDSLFDRYTLLYPSFILRNSHFSSMVSLNCDELNLTDEQLCNSLASRLVRLLAWPALYSQAKYQIRTFNDTILPDVDLDLPYNINDEVNAFIHEMEQRYPVLTDNLMID